MIPCIGNVIIRCSRLDRTVKILQSLAAASVTANDLVYSPYYYHTPVILIFYSYEQSVPSTLAILITSCIHTLISLALVLIQLGIFKSIKFRFQT